MTDGPTYRFWGKAKPKSDAILCKVEPRLSDDSTKATIRIYGPIDSWGGFWGVSAKEVAEALDELDPAVTDLQLRLNSPGGEAWEGMAILNLLRAHPANVTAVVDGIAASAASVIAVGCDETVMSPGSELMIHDPYCSAWGCNATEMRKTADVLDKLAESLASIYAEAAGGKQSTWREAMVEETWYTADEAVEAKLADRVAVVPDAGKTTTAGDDPTVVVVPTSEDPEDMWDLSLFTYAGRSKAPAPAAMRRGPKPPTASADGSTQPEGGPAVAFSDEQLTTMRQKLGVAENADEATILAALDEALAEGAEEPAAAKTTEIPEGMALVDSEVLAELRNGAEAGRTARQELDNQAREGAITAALRAGKITAARKDHWTTAWDADPEGTKSLLDKLEPGLVPVDEIGTADANDPESTSLDDAALEAYASQLGLSKEALRG
jgi:ATP-dependent protease ClpP protease subunit